MTDDSARGLAPSTRAVTTGRPAAEPGAPVNPPIVMSSTYHAGGAPEYGREGNPTWWAFEEAVADLEGAAGALCFASGIAAIDAVLDLVPAGGVVVAPAHPYSNTRARLHELHTGGRIVLREYVAGPDADIAEALEGAHLLWVESPTNPLLQVSDVVALARHAKACGALTAVDSTFSSPYCAQPLTWGADIVVHSATKYIAGHSDLLMGVLAAKDADLLAALKFRRVMNGSVSSPFEAWLALRGVRTLAVRMERHLANAAVIAERLREHPKVDSVRWPGFADHPGHALALATTGPCAIVGFEAGTPEQAEAICQATTLWTHATSIGGVESLIERRARYAFEHPDLPPSLIRLSVGIEDADDLWHDLDGAIDRCVP